MDVWLEDSGSTALDEIKEQLKIPRPLNFAMRAIKQLSVYDTLYFVQHFIIIISNFQANLLRQSLSKSVMRRLCCQASLYYHYLGFFFLICLGFMFIMSKAKASTIHSQKYCSLLWLCGAILYTTCEFNVSLMLYVRPILQFIMWELSRVATYLTSGRRIQKFPFTTKSFTELLPRR